MRRKDYRYDIGSLIVESRLMRSLVRRRIIVIDCCSLDEMHLFNTMASLIVPGVGLRFCPREQINP
jgi:hypothetical protein